MLRFCRQAMGLVTALTLVLAWPATAQDVTAERWSASWASAQMVADGENALPTLSGESTLRQVVRLSAGGSRMRLRISNRFGRETLRIDGASVARAVGPGQSGIVPGSDHELSFGDHASVAIPPGADYLSDPVELSVPAGADVAISLKLTTLPAQQTGHPGARATSFLAQGDQIASPVLVGAQSMTRWYLLAAIDIEGQAPAVIGLLGDSITDGYGVPPDTNQRWSDRLSERLRNTEGLQNAAVLNLGIGGNRMLQDGLGPNAMSRLDRDVLSQSGITHVIVLQGVNDLGVLTRDAPASAQAHAMIVRDMIAAYQQLVAQARSAGVVAIGATIMPFAGSAYYHPGQETEADRQAINAWIRTPGNFDAVIDFDAVTRDPQRPDRLRADVDGGDGLHPSMDGYRIMGDAVPLALFQEKP